VRQENAFTKAGRLSRLPDRLEVACSAGAGLGGRRPKEIGRGASVGSAVSRLPLLLLPASPSFSDRCDGSMWQADPFRTWIARLSSAIGGGASLGTNPAGGQASASSTPCCAFASSPELARSVRTQRRVRTTAPACDWSFRSRFSGDERAFGGTGQHRSCFKGVPYPVFRGSGGQRISVCFQQPPSLPRGFLAMRQQFPFVPKL
jgi:hypothetical protein